MASPETKKRAKDGCVVLLFVQGVWCFRVCKKVGRGVVGKCGLPIFRGCQESCQVQKLGKWLGLFTNAYDPGFVS